MNEQSAAGEGVREVPTGPDPTVSAPLPPADPADPPDPQVDGHHGAARDAQATRIPPVTTTATGPAAASATAPMAGPAVGYGSDPTGADPADTDPADTDQEHSDQVRRWREKSAKRQKRASRPFWVELPILIVIAFALTFLIQTFIAKVYYVPSGSMEQTLHGAPSGGDRILASKIVYDFRDPHQGDVVVFKGPDTWAPEADIPGPSSWFGKAMEAVGSVVGIAPPNEKDFVKRVIAVGGQTVACCDKQGNVTVDGRSLDEPYIFEPIPFEAGNADNDCTVSSDGLSYASKRCFAPFKVPDGQLWVMGDHRSYSSDSSYYCQGRTAEGEKAITDETPGGLDCNRPIPVDNVIGKAIFIVMPPSRWGTIGDPDIDPGNPALSGPAVSTVPSAGGLVLMVGLRGGLALTPARRRRRRDRRAARR